MLKLFRLSLIFAMAAFLVQFKIAILKIFDRVILKMEDPDQEVQYQ